jgi:hypothetical protein
VTRPFAGGGGGVPPPPVGGVADGVLPGGIGLVGSIWKTESLLGPPQYSVLLPVHVMLHPLVLGSEEVWKTAPAVIELAQ